MVSRNAMINAGTARRNAGSAVSSRRYAGLAIDCANPLIESARADAPAASARAMPRPRLDDPLESYASESACPYRFESDAIRIDGDSLVESPSQYFWLTSPQKSTARRFCTKRGFRSRFNTLNPARFT